MEVCSLGNSARSGFGLVQAKCMFVMKNLTLQIGYFDGIVINNSDFA